MRQAGRCLPRYRELRRRFGFLELARTPELAAEVTCLPVELLGVDAAVIFADITLPLIGMGVEFEIEEGAGPVVTDPLRSEGQVARLAVVEAEAATPYLFESIRLSRERLGRSAALVGFAAAPFTLACYLVEGRATRDYPRVRAMIHSEPRLWHRLMGTLTEVLGRHLEAQVGAGAQVVQLFDSWVGVLDRASFLADVAPHLTALVARLHSRAPVIYFSTGSSHLLDLAAATGPDGLGVDWRLPLDRAWDLVGRDHFIQGNLDPALLLCPWEELARGAREVLARAGGAPGHVFNLGHGVLPETDSAELRRLVDLVHEASARSATAPP